MQGLMGVKRIRSWLSELFSCSVFLLDFRAMRLLRGASKTPDFEASVSLVLLGTTGPTFAAKPDFCMQANCLHLLIRRTHLQLRWRFSGHGGCGYGVCGKLWDRWCFLATRFKTSRRNGENHAVRGRFFAFWASSKSVQQVKLTSFWDRLEKCWEIVGRKLSNEDVRVSSIYCDIGHFSSHI